MSEWMRILLLFTTVMSAACGEPAGLRTWLTKLETVRPCLVPFPGENGRTSAAIAELVQPTAWHCQKSVLAIYTADRSDDRGWDRAMNLLRDATRGGSAIERGTVLDQLDVEIAALRRRVGLPAITRSGDALPVLPPGTAITIVGRPLSKSMIQSPSFFRGGLIAGQDRREASVIDFIVDAPNAVRTWGHPPETVLAYPSGTWSTSAAAFPGEYYVLDAADIGAVRAVVLQIMSRDARASFAVATSNDSGWRVLPVLEGTFDGSSQDPRSGIIDAVTRGGDNVYIRRIDALDNGQLPPSTRVPRGVEYALCMHGGHTWYRSSDGIYRFDGKQGENFAAGLNAHIYLVDCRNSAALILRHAPETLERCQSGSCTEVFVGGRRHGAAALLDGGTWIYAASVDGIVGIWREGAAAPRFYRLDAPGELAAISVLRGVPYLVLEDAEHHYRLVAVP